MPSVIKFATAARIGAFLLGAVPSVAEDCVPGWASRFASRNVFASASLYGYDDGVGPALYDGPTWRWRGGRAEQFSDQPLCCGPYALRAHDDGTGRALYCGAGLLGGGGQFFYRIARWDGHFWSAVGGGLPNSGTVRALTEFDAGDGLALYAGTVARSHLSADTCLWKWDGVTWTASATIQGFDVTIHSLYTYDDGRGPALYAAGSFASVNGVAAHNIARWDGQTWEPLGAGPSDTSGGDVYAMIEFDTDGAGPQPPDLMVAGEFEYAGSVDPLNIARWDGQDWSTVGVVGLGTRFDAVYALEVFDEGGAGPGSAALFAGGEFVTADGVTVNNIARWDGQQWSALHPDGVARAVGWPAQASLSQAVVEALEVFDDGHGAALYVGGDFTLAGDAAAGGFAMWDGQQFFGFGDGHGLSDYATQIRTADDGGGDDLYVTGNFAAAGSVVVDDGLARWDGYAWSALPDFGARADAREVAQFHTTAGPRLVVGGRERVSGVPGIYAVPRLALLQGQHWEFIDGLEPWPGCSADCYVYGGAGVESAIWYDDGNGAALFVGGNFAGAGGVPGTATVARWDGANWSSVGGGITGAQPRYTVVKEFIAHDDGSGPALIAVGSFTHAGGVAANNVAKWDGQSWSALGGGVAGHPGDTDPWVYDAEVYDSGAGPQLYVVGELETADGQPVGGIARWNGSAWSGVGGGLWRDANCSPSTPGLAAALHVFDDGSGPALYVGGYFQCAGGLAVHNFVRWNGQQWSDVAGGTSAGVLGLATFNDGRGPGLYLAGRFVSVGPSEAPTPSAYIARYGCLDTEIPGDLDCDGRVSFLDIDPFLLALFDPAAYAAAFPDCRIENGDLNADAAVDLFDIDPFIACLFAVCP